MPKQWHTVYAAYNVYMLYIWHRFTLKHGKVVGITEQFDDFIAVLDAIFPDFFNGLISAWKAGLFGLQNFQNFSRKIDILEGEQITQKGATLTKSLPSNEARQELKKRMKYQIDLYNLAKKRFYELKSSLLKHRRFPTHLDPILDKITIFDSK